MTTLPGQYTGWHHYCYPADKYECQGIDDDCANTAGCRLTNYYRCKPCTNRQWFMSKIRTFNTDDIARAEAQRRIKAAEPLKVHSKMREVHVKFRKRGGIIRILGNPRDLPAVTWTDTSSIIRRVVYPPHIRSDCLHGTARAIAKANALAVVVDKPFASEDMN